MHIHIYLASSLGSCAAWGNKANTYMYTVPSPSFLPSLLPSFLACHSSRIPSGQSVPPPTVILEGSGHSGRGDKEDEDEEDSQFLVEDATPLDPPPTEAFLGGNEADKPEGSLMLLRVSLAPIPHFSSLVVLYC